MHTTIAMILAGGRVAELSVLTERRAKAAVIFGGRYRTVDFALTNLANAGIGRVGILAQYRPSSLVDHVGIGLAWDLVGTNRAVRFLSPYMGPDRGEWYRGPADALYQNIDFIQYNAPDDVLLVSGDHVSSMDYQPLLNFHRERSADFTMAFKPIDDNPSRFGIGELNSVGQIVNFTEKPQFPRTNLAAIGVYLFKRQVLLDELFRMKSGKEEVKTFHLYEIIQRMIPRRSAYGWIFHGEWYYARTLDEYFQFHQNLLGPRPHINLINWQVRSSPISIGASSFPPTHYLPGAQVEDSYVCAGCVIAGKVSNSIVSPGVRIEKDAIVNNSILWDNVVVKEGANLDTVISDKRTVFGKKARIGSGENMPSEEMPQSLTCGASVFGMDVAVPDKAIIGRNCIIHPEVGEIDLKGPVQSGKSVLKRGPTAREELS
jgi:glucose-1-phosphate adenylyltransferase